MGELSLAARRHHHEVQIGALGAAVEDPEIDIELLVEVVHDLRHDVGLGRRGQTQHRRHRVISGPLADEASHVPVVGPEIVPPSREAVGLVQHPGTDLPLIEDAAHRAVAKLLGRDDEDTGVPHPHPIQGIGSLRHGQKPVDRDAGIDAPRLESRHLVGHEGDQRRDHHRQGAGLVVAGQGGDLIAKRFACTGWQDCQHVLSRHRRLDDGLLHGSPGLVRRLRAEAVKAEPTSKLLAGIVPFPAPLTGGIDAGDVAQPTHQPSRLRELMPHPGRHDRVAA